MPKYKKLDHNPEWTLLNWIVQSSEAGIFLAAFRYRVDAEKYVSSCHDDEELEIVRC